MRKINLIIFRQPVNGCIVESHFILPRIGRHWKSPQMGKPAAGNLMINKIDFAYSLESKSSWGNTAMKGIWLCEVHSVFSSASEKTT
jgi:hypothetical protein